MGPAVRRGKRSAPVARQGSTERIDVKSGAMESESAAMTDREKYLFDVQGYLLVRGFLTPEEVARLNAAIDANQEKMTEHEGSYLGNSSTLGGEAKRGVLSGMLEWEHP